MIILPLAILIFGLGAITEFKKEVTKIFPGKFYRSKGNFGCKIIYKSEVCNRSTKLVICVKHGFLYLHVAASINKLLQSNKYCMSCLCFCTTTSSEIRTQHYAVEDGETERLSSCHSFTLHI